MTSSLHQTFAQNSQNRQSDAYFLLNHIFKEEAFHIVEGDEAGKYVWKETGLHQYQFSLTQGSHLIKASLTANNLLKAIMGMKISLEQNALEGSASPSQLTTDILSEIVEKQGFSIKTGFGRGNYALSTDRQGQTRLEEIHLLVINRQISGTQNSPATLSATDFLTALKDKQLEIGAESNFPSPQNPFHSAGISGYRRYPNI